MTASPPSEKSGLHPRNRDRAGYDFAALVRASPELARFVTPAPHGGDSIDFADPAAVTALNRALLRLHYGIAHWAIPPGFLTPPVPGRADYLHHLADLLALDRGGAIPRGASVAILDVGVGANCIYPIVGVAEYGWRFVGSDIDRVALGSAEAIVAANPTLAPRVAFRLQPSPAHVLRGVVQPGETFAATICNPPFHASAAEAAAATRRKLRNLAGRTLARAEPGRNFGGRPGELWTPGGERAFLLRLVAESAERPDASRWFTTLVSKAETLPVLQRALHAARAREVRVVAMAQGQKRSRMLAWSFRR